MRRFLVVAASAALFAGIVTQPAAAEDILINVSKSSQRMSVMIDGSAKYNWLVSTGARRYTTPNGVYKPTWLARKWKSRQYNMAPMPNSIFFHQGYAIHGTDAVGALGRIASHGCVRLSPQNSARLFAMVQRNMGSTTIVVSDDVIEKPGQAPVKRKPSLNIAETTGDRQLPAAKSAAALDSYALAPEAKTSAVIKDPEVTKAPEVIRSPEPASGVARIAKIEPVEKFEKPSKAEKIEKVDIREKPEPREAAKRTRTAERSSSKPGFRW